MGLDDGLSGPAAGVLGTEVCLPLVLLCWLCCWPDDTNSDTSSTGKHPRKPVMANVSGSRRRSTELFRRRVGSSAASLHLPSTSGQKKEPLSAHRSHEEIPSRRRSNLEPREEETRYHSAPSVIDEVLHRRDWERSSKDLYIPLRPEAELIDSDDNSPEAPRAEPESSSIEEGKSSERLHVPCKKHYTNIKSSRNKTKKESTTDDVKDTDATEISENISHFYIGDTKSENSMLSSSREVLDNDDKMRLAYQAKEAKQSFNESIKTLRPKTPPLSEDNWSLEGNVSVPLGAHVKKFLELEISAEELDRSGAMHHSPGSRSSLVTCLSRLTPYPPPSVEAADYESGACYLSPGEAGPLRRVRELVAAHAVHAVRGVRGVRGVHGPHGAHGPHGPRGRSRHASDGDILAPAPAHRPESGAFSESDLELELERSEERPPPYHELQLSSDRKETAI